MSARHAALFCLFVLSAAPWSRADQALIDQERSAWRYRRDVLLGASEGAPPLAALILPPEITTHTKSDLSDLRLIDRQGIEAPWLIDRLARRTTLTRQVGRLIDVRREKKTSSLWVIDLDAPREFDQLELEVAQGDFAKGLRIEASLDAANWRVLRADAGIFDRPFSPRVRHTRLALGEVVSARYLRLSADDRRSPPIDIVGASVALARETAAEEWQRPAALSLLYVRDRQSCYRLDAPPGMSFDRLTLSADDAAFVRRVRVTTTRQINGRAEETSLADGTLYRLRIAEEALAGESLSLAVGQRGAGETHVIIDNGDSPPLRNPRVTLGGIAARLLFPSAHGDLTLYYGNPATRAPVYDLASLEPRLSLSKDFRAVHIGEEQANPRWAQAPPLAFATQMGARINTSEWRHMRVVAIARGDDLYTLSLTASDVSRLRPELGDLRVVSDDDRQVPYILALRAASERVPLQIQKVAASRTDARVSRYRLGFAAPIEAGAALPWESLEIAIREGFFSRPARLTVAGQSSRGRAQERVLYAGLIARKDTAETTIRLDLDGAPYSELFFEIDEGDNAPLTLQRAHAWVPVPRVAFKARAGEYRLLLGNDNARPPQYDLAALRGEVLAYSAVPITAQPLALNPTFRRRATDYFRKTPPALWLWVTLVSAVVVLLLLTVRILKQPLPPAPPEA